MDKKYHHSQLLELKQLSDLLKNPNLTLLQRASLRIRYESLADEIRERGRLQT